MTQRTSAGGQAAEQNVAGRDRNLAVSLFVFLLGLYMLTYNGTMVSTDELGLLAGMESLYKHGSFEMPQLTWYGYTKGVFEPAQIALAGLLYFAAQFVPNVGAVQAAFLFNVLVTAATGSLLFLYVRRLGYSQFTGVIVALIWGVATTAWAYSKFLFREPLAGLFLLASAYFLQGLRPHGEGRGLPTGWVRNAVLGAAAFGLVVATKETMLIALPVLALVGLLNAWEGAGWRRRPSLAYAGALLVGAVATVASLALIGLYNESLLGSPSLGARQVPLAIATGLSVTPEMWQAILQMPFSTDKGLFTHSPILLLGIVSAVLLVKQRRPVQLVLPVLLTIVFFRAYATTWWTWWGGLTWGPRYFVPLLPFIAALLAPLVQYAHERRSLLIWGGFVALALVSLVIQIGGVAVSIARFALVLGCTGRTEDWTIQMTDPRYSEITGHLRMISPENLNFAWVRVSGGEWVGCRLAGATVTVDWLPPALCLLVAVVGAAALVRFLRRPQLRLPGRAAVLALVATPLMLAALLLPRYYDLPHYEWEEAWKPLVAELAKEERSGDVLILNAPQHSEFLLNYRKSAQLWYGLSSQSYPPKNATLLAQIAGSYRRIWLASEDFPDPSDRGVERWLAENTFPAIEKAFEYPARLRLYLTPAQPAPDPSSLQPVAAFGQGIELLGARYLTETLRAGDFVPVSLYWRARQSALPDYTVSVQVWDATGRLRAQTDGGPVTGFRPTSTWATGEVVTDNHTLKLPADLEPSAYTLALMLYAQPSLARLPVTAPLPMLAQEGTVLLLGELGVGKPVYTASPYPVLR